MTEIFNVAEIPAEDWERLDALHQSYMQQERQAGEFTRKEYWQRMCQHNPTGITYSQSAAYKELEQLVAEGKLLTREEGRMNGHPCKWYRLA